MSSDTSTRTEFAHIVRTPGTMGGEPRIEEHRIRVRDIVAARDLGGLTPEGIAARFTRNCRSLKSTQRWRITKVIALKLIRRQRTKNNSSSSF